MKKIILALIAVVLTCSVSQATTYTVNAIDLWDSTGLALTSSDNVTISGAAGTWTWATWSGDWTGPNGDSAASDATNWIPSDPKAELIGYIGPDNPLTGNTSNGYLFGIGTNTVNLSGKAGTLWFGINDDFNCGGCQYDNAGSLTVNASVPEPSTLLLLGSGMAGLVAMRRLRKR